MPIQQVTAAAAEPLSLIETKTHLRQTGITADDTLIKALIRGARRLVEQKTQRQIVAGRWKLVLDSFPGPSLMGVPFGKPFSLPEHAILIPKTPVLQIVSIQYTAMDGTIQTLVAGTDYVVDLASEPVRITPPFGKIWPIPLPQIGAVSATFDIGHCAVMTANAVSDQISIPAWKTLAVNDTLRVFNRDVAALNDGALPGGLAINTDYYVRSVVSPGVYTLSATSGGSLLDITTNGTGESFVGELPDGMLDWMKLSMGTLYENREAVAIDVRLTSAELPLEFIDGLLDPYRLVFY